MSQILIRRIDQATIGALTLLALAGMAAWWISAGGHRGQLIEIDQAEPLSYQFLVDVNEADWPELAQLPGLGETLARRIVESRELDGPYDSLEEIQRVKGIGPRKFEAMRRYLLPMIDSTQVADEAQPDFKVENQSG